MAIRPEEVTSILQQELEAYKTQLKLEEVGTILQVGDGIARIYGLENCMTGELLEFPGGVMGMALNLEAHTVGAVVLGSDQNLKDGDLVKRTGKIVQVPVGKALLGRVVDALGRPLDGQGPIVPEGYRPVEGRAPSVVERQPVKEPLMTGLKAIDAMIPIGRGQRELIIGDRDWAETLYCRRCCGDTQTVWRHGTHHRGECHRRGSRLPSISGSVQRLCDGGTFPLQWQACFGGLR
jgi:F-type H+-transporting ATPase subunit alpha